MRPRIRTLKPELWADERIVALSRDARLLFVTLITMADDEGRFRLRRSAILGFAFADDDDAPGLIDGWVAEIKRQGLVLLYVVEGTTYGAFRHWRRHQQINKARPSELPPPPDPKVVRENRRSPNSRSATGGLRERSGSSHTPTRGRALRSDPDPDPVVLDLCKRLAARVCANDPKATPQPDGERWLADMRLLLNDRGGDAQELERIIDWCQADSFWRSNILSPAKLRKQFTQLVLKAAAGNVVPIGSPASYLPESQRPTPEWQAQVKAHLEAQRGGA